MKKIISLFDFTGIAVEPWANDGYDCHIYDIKHWRPSTHKEGYIDNKGFRHHHENITARHADLFSL